MLRHHVVRFDAELLVHRAPSPVGCAAGVVHDEPTPWGPPGQTVRVVRRCTRNTGHTGPHRVAPTRHRAVHSTATLCGVSLDEGAWIDWQTAEDDPLCPACHGGVVYVPAEQAAML